MKIYKIGDETFVTKAEAARYIGIPRTTFRRQLKQGGGAFSSEKGRVFEIEINEQSASASATLPISPILQQIADRVTRKMNNDCWRRV